MNGLGLLFLFIVVYWYMGDWLKEGTTKRPARYHSRIGWSARKRKTGIPPMVKQFILRVVCAGLLSLGIYGLIWYIFHPLAFAR